MACRTTAKSECKSHHAKIGTNRKQKYSEDIELHRKIMKINMFPEDISKLTAPVIFSYPSSPHLAAKIDKKELDIDAITLSSKILKERYDVVLLEGAGGLMVPLTPDLLTIDYISQQNYPIILVTSGRLGSINHTLLSLEAIKNRNLKLYSVIYNLSPYTDEVIVQDSLKIIDQYIRKNFPEAFLIQMPEVTI